MGDASTLRVAVVGAGLMGTNHARVIAASALGRVEVVVDVNAAAAERLAEAHGARWSTEAAAALDCGAVVIAAPTENHLELGETPLRAGIPTLIEKPLAPGADSSDALIETARLAGTPLMCGLVERFNPAVTTARELIDEAPIRHLLSVRHSPPAPRIRADVIDDMLIHDLDLALMITGEMPTRTACLGWGPEPGRIEMAEATLEFGGGLAHLSANRRSQHKVRTLAVSTDEGLYDVDLLRQTLTVYRHRSHSLDPAGGYRSDTAIELPFVRHAGEPLALQWRRFFELATGAADSQLELETYGAPHRLADQLRTMALASSPKG